MTAEPSATIRLVAILDRDSTLPLDRIPDPDISELVRRIVKSEPAAPTIDVAAFSSAI